MRTSHFRMTAGWFVLGVIMLSVTISSNARAQAPAVDAAAVQILQRMTDYLGSLQQFSVRTQNTLEDVLDSGHRVDIDVSAKVIVSRPALEWRRTLCIALSGVSACTGSPHEGQTVSPMRA